jgi:toxin ParE1/3/4
MAHRLAPTAEADLDNIWYYTAKESPSVEIADRVVDSITERLFLLSTYPHVGRRRDEDLRPGLRSFPVGEYVIIYRGDDDVLIPHVMRGSRDIEALLSRMLKNPSWLSFRGAAGDEESRESFVFRARFLASLGMTTFTGVFQHPVRDGYQVGNPVMA